MSLNLTRKYSYSKQSSFPRLTRANSSVNRRTRNVLLVNQVKMNNNPIRVIETLFPVKKRVAAVSAEEEQKQPVLTPAMKKQADALYITLLQHYLQYIDLIYSYRSYSELEKSLYQEQYNLNKRKSVTRGKWINKKGEIEKIKEKYEKTSFLNALSMRPFLSTRLEIEQIRLDAYEKVLDIATREKDKIHAPLEKNKQKLSDTIEGLLSLYSISAGNGRNNGDDRNNGNWGKITHRNRNRENSRNNNNEKRNVFPVNNRKGVTVADQMNALGKSVVVDNGVIQKMIEYALGFKQMLQVKIEQYETDEKYQFTDSQQDPSVFHRRLRALTTAQAEEMNQKARKSETVSARNQLPHFKKILDLYKQYDLAKQEIDYIEYKAFLRKVRSVDELVSYLSGLLL